jgi:hypothetical protein
MLLNVCQSQSYVTTDGQSASLSWNKAPIWGLRPDLYYCLTVTGFFDVVKVKSQMYICIFLLYILGSDLIENMSIAKEWTPTVMMYCCRFYLATDCLSKGCICVETCSLSRCLAADGS